MRKKILISKLLKIAYENNLKTIIINFFME